MRRVLSEVGRGVPLPPVRCGRRECWMLMPGVRGAWMSSVGAAARVRDASGVPKISERSCGAAGAGLYGDESKPKSGAAAAGAPPPPPFEVIVRVVVCGVACIR